MATLRSSLPSRLRQLFSNEGSFGPSLQLDSEPPHQIRGFIDKVIQCPLQDITIPLSGFRWEYDKGNFHHWRPLFHHFNAYFKTYLSCRNDLLLLDHVMGDDAFPKRAVLQILRVMHIIFENCHNKSSFDGLEHFELLLASTDPEVLIASLETLCALVKIHPSKLHMSGKLIGLGSINSRLLSLAQGWGSKEEGLGLYSCVVENEKSQEGGLALFPSDVHGSDIKSQYRLGSTLYFELHGVSPQRSGESSSNANSVASSVIQMLDLHLCKEEDLLLLKQCLNQYNVPLDQRFSLLTRIRYARAFRSPKTCRLYSRICLLSFIVLVQSNDELVSFFANEPEYINELIRIVRAEEIISGTIRTLSMLALGAQSAAYIASHDRARILSGSSVNFTGGNRMILLNVLQKAILSLNRSSDPSSHAFVEALLQFYLLHVVSTASSGNVIRGSGLVSTFLPLLEDSDPSRMHLVCCAVKTLQKLMEYSNAALNLFRDLGGVELLAHRLQVEVQRLTGLGGPKSESSTMIAECSSYNNEHWYIQKRLIKAVMKTLGSASYAPTNASRSFSPNDSSLPSTLSLIFGNVDKFGGDIYCSAVTVMSEILHKDPTCFPALHELGLPDAFLTSVAAGIYPSSKALACIPSGIGAICLNNKGLELVKGSSVLRFLVDIFTCRNYTIPMNDAVVPLADAVEELLRHVSSLRATGVDIIIEIVDKIASVGEGGSLESFEKGDGNTVMDMDSGEGGSGPCSSLVSMSDSSGEGISDEQFIHLSIFHLMVLIHRTMENSETCRLFVEKSGIATFMKLLLRPSIIQSSEGMAIALRSTLVFKGFAQHHSAPLARVFCSALREHLKKILTGFSVVSGSLLNPKSKLDSGVFPSMFLVEFLLFLSSSRDSRWLTALLTEFGGGGKDVLEDIGRVHRQILWQIALLEDSKLDVQVDTSVSLSESQQLISVTSGTVQQRIPSSFIDPLLRRRASGWSMDSQYFDLLNMYRDIGRVSGTHQQHSSDISNVRSSSSSHLTQSECSNADGIARSEEEKHKTNFTSCCDMARSLSFHILHMFQELGKVMLVPSRRRDDTFNVSSSSKTVGATFAAIALEHLNFDGHMSHGLEAPVSSKCRYYGKVVDFIDGILMDMHDSCNPILLNCSFGLGVIQSVLTTFQATSQLLFSINRSPTSLMDTDNTSSKQGEKEQLEHSWIYGPLSSYGKLMDHLVTSSYILSPSTKHVLVQHISDGHVPFPKDAETFVKVLQSMVLKNVLPVWTHPEFVDCGYDFVRFIISIICHVYSGVEVKNVDSSPSARITMPPPNESVISTIVEMGFSRLRVEEALRQVGANSVELAMEWLFSHSEEIQEDDELACALAMSLGNSGSNLKEDGDQSIQPFEEDIIQLPPIDQLLSTCVKLLQTKESLAFPVRDLLIRMCSQDDGQNKTNIVTFIIDQIKSSCSASDAGKDDALSALFHVLALMLHEDPTLRDVAWKKGLVDLASDLLCQCYLGSSDEKKSLFPKWISAAFLAVDQLLQVDKNLNPDIVELLKRSTVEIQQNAIIIDEDRQNKAQPAEMESSPQQVVLYHQKRLIQVACSCIRKQLPSETMHAVLQLCATLTRNHLLAVNFLDIGGLQLLLNLPESCFFSGYDNVAATIIRHILEDPQTLQQAMESEIKHSFSAANRHFPGKLTPRNFLSNLTSVISRDPVVFMRAAQYVCQVETVGDRPYVVLLKDRDKDKSKEKDKALKKVKAQLDGKVVSGSTGSPGVVVGCGKLIESNKNVKSHRKPPNSFVCVIECLLDLLLAVEPPLRGDSTASVVSDLQTVSEMDIDAIASKGKGKAVDSTSECTETNKGSASLTKILFILKMLTEILMTYSASVHVLLRKDAEVSRCTGPLHRSSTGYASGGIFNHVLHKFVPHAKNSKKEQKLDSDYKLATRASQLMVASCIRSAEARKRVFTEVNFVFHEFVKSARGFICPGHDLQAFIDLLNDVLGARSLTGVSISAEAVGTFTDAGLFSTLTQIPQVLDLDHSESSKLVTGLVKALETVSKEHVATVGKVDITVKLSDNNQRECNEDSDAVQLREAGTIEQNLYATFGHIQSFNAVQTFGESEAVTDHMELDQDLGGFAPSNEDDYMNDTPGAARVLENGMDNVAIRYEIRPDGQDNIVDEEDEDEDDMSENDGEENEDDEPNGLEEDEEHHLSHPDTDHDDHMADEDEFDEEVFEEDEEEEEEDDEYGMILRLEEGINETFNAMGSENLGSRRQGRSMSIYNLLARTGDNAIPPQHPLLMESHPSLSAISDNARDIMASDRNIDSTSSRLDTVVRYMRTGRQGQGYRFNLWADGNQASNASGSSVIPQALEDFLMSHLRRPDTEKPSDQKAAIELENRNDEAPLQESSTIVRAEDQDENNANDQNNHGPVPSFAALDNSIDTGNRTGETVGPQGINASDMQSNPHEMQLELNDLSGRDVEVVSQESGGSGATLGESLRSLDVEIGSADGHDDGGDRPLSEMQGTRSRRSSVPFGTSVTVSVRETSLHSLSEIVENPLQETDQGVPAEGQHMNEDVSGSIDPAFLDALPEELRVEVLSAQQGQVAQPSNSEHQNTEDIDPEFLAALPPDIRAEVLAQQQAQRLNQSQELEGQPVEMDAVSIIATFPSDLREEVLLTSSEAVLANLSPALVAEANMLRERFAHRHHSRNLFGIYPRSRRGEPSRRGEGSSLDRVGGSASQKHRGSRLLDAEGAPLVDSDALKGMVRLLQVFQLVYKGQLQRLLLNLCAHNETRTELVKILMEMLMLGTQKCGNQWTAAEPSYRLYACHSHVMYSRPQFSNGVPPMVSRRLLETLTYLARNHPSVAKILLDFRLSRQSEQSLESLEHWHGKAAMLDKDIIEKGQEQEGKLSITLLLGLLNQPLYLRSIAHLEQLLNLLDVIIDGAERKSSTVDGSGLLLAEQQSDPEVSAPNAEMNTNAATDDSQPDEARINVEAANPSTSGTHVEYDVQTVLHNLPQTEMRLLCSLLAKEGLSDNAYASVAEIMKKLAAITTAHCHLFITELAISVHKLTKLAMEELLMFSEAEKSLLQSTSYSGASILRVLQALSSLVSSFNGKEKDKLSLSEKEHYAAVALSMVRDINGALEPLWLELSSCLSKFESVDLNSSSQASRSEHSTSMPPLPAGTQNILPYIESFFVTCEKIHPGQPGASMEFAVAVVPEVDDASTSASKQTSGHASKIDEMNNSFVKFSDRHRKLLNAFIRQNPRLLEKSFSLMLKVPRFIDFDNKRSHFRSKIKHQQDHRHHHSSVRISVRRAYILEDSYNQLRMRSTQELKGRLAVHFQGEEGIDAGGLTREWYQLLSKVIFDKGALLFTTVGNDSTFQPNPNSVYQTEHLSYFKFVGRVVGKALLDGQLLDVHFTRSFYKHILGAKVTYHDIEAIDPDFYKNLKWMLENNISDVLDLTFSIDADEEKLILYERTEVTDYELIPDGRNMKVTEENKHQYVDLIAENRLTTAIRPQINAFLEGFNELIPRELISIFHDKELELLISGLPDIDLNDMRENTDYFGYSLRSPVIQWFWEVVQGFSKEEKARLLQFVTGTSKVPLEGFSALQGISGSQKFQIHKAYGSIDHLPSAHTCFNQLDLPEYPSKEHLQDRLRLAIHEGNEGFGFG